MELTKKLILEDLLDEPDIKSDETSLDNTIPDVTSNIDIPEPQLTEPECDNFNLGIISDVLNKDLDLFNFIQSILQDKNIKEEVNQILLSVADDLALSIGKLQEGIKLAADDHNEELITQGQVEVKDIDINVTED